MGRTKKLRLAQASLGLEGPAGIEGGSGTAGGLGSDTSGDETTIGFNSGKASEGDGLGFDSGEGSEGEGLGFAFGFVAGASRFADADAATGAGGVPEATAALNVAALAASSAPDIAPCSVGAGEAGSCARVAGTTGSAAGALATTLAGAAPIACIGLERECNIKTPANTTAVTTPPDHHEPWRPLKSAARGPGITGALGLVFVSDVSGSGTRSTGAAGFGVRLNAGA